MTLLSHQLLILLSVIGIIAGVALVFALVALRRFDALTDRVMEVEAWNLLLERRLHAQLRAPADPPTTRRHHPALGIIEEEQA